MHRQRVPTPPRVGGHGTGRNPKALAEQLKRMQDGFAEQDQPRKQHEAPAPAAAAAAAQSRAHKVPVVAQPLQRQLVWPTQDALAARLAHNAIPSYTAPQSFTEGGAAAAAAVAGAQPPRYAFSQQQRRLGSRNQELSATQRTTDISANYQKDLAALESTLGYAQLLSFESDATREHQQQIENDRALALQLQENDRIAAAQIAADEKLARQLASSMDN